jgi:hypothetical protein
MRQDLIAARAYVLWEAAGRPRGRDLEFWTRAEGEVDAILAKPVPPITHRFRVLEVDRN